MEIISCSTELPRKAGAYLSSVIATYENKPLLLLLSGGSAVSLLEYADLSKSLGNITVSVLDERFTKDEKGRNFIQIKNVLQEAPVQFFQPFPETAESVEEAARFFEAGLRNWRSIHPDGVIVATMGIGPDGHTAGMFPEEEAELFRRMFVDTDSWVVGYTAPTNTYPERVTVTAAFLLGEVSDVIVYLQGKADIVAKLDEDIPLHAMPSAIIKRIAKATVMTDTKE